MDIPGPVYLDCISRLMLNAHGSFRHSRPFAVFVTGQGTSVRRAADFVAFAAIFFPKKSQRSARLCKITVNVRIIWLNVSPDFRYLFGEKFALARRW